MPLPSISNPSIPTLPAMRPRSGDVLAEARAACADLCLPGQMRRHQDLLTRARVMHAAITMRARMRHLQQRTTDLRAALLRFEDRRRALQS